MSTGDLQRLERAERLLVSALHEADLVPVDLRGGRARLAPRLIKEQRAVRRRWAISVAASVLALVVTAAILLAGLRRQVRARRTHRGLFSDLCCHA
jgi:ABC-type spermidine/putrescine transport system permease subunit I